MGNKDPTPKADGLRAMREASRGHLQATAIVTTIEKPSAAEVPFKMEKPPKPKLVPYAGKAPGSRNDLIGNKPPNTKPPRARRKYKRKTS